MNWPTSIPDDCQKKIRDIVEYWVAIHPLEGLPGRQHLDPAAIPHLLPNVRLLDVVGEPPRFFTRLMGTRLRDFYGREHTGHWYDEMFPHFMESQTCHDLIATVDTKQPVWRQGKPNLNYEKEFLVLERVFLPFAGDGVKVDMVMTLVLFGDSKGGFC